MDNIYIEDVIKEIKSILKDKRIVSFHQKPFYGVISCHLQDGKQTHFKVESTHK